MYNNSLVEKGPSITFQTASFYTFLSKSPRPRALTEVEKKEVEECTKVFLELENNYDAKK